MPKPRIRTYSNYAIHAAILLGKKIKLGRKQRRWTEQELAERIGISRGTLKKIEKGDMRCEIGLVFEAATLVGVPLFDQDLSRITMDIDRTDDKLALLPRSIRKSSPEVDDDF
jgi:transcriptional regulator with XRE-family HTH domain